MSKKVDNYGIPSVQDTLFWESAVNNNMQFNTFYYELVNLATSIFKWENLPASVDERFLEMLLVMTGKALFSYDERMVVNENDSGLIVTRYAMNGSLNMYGIPTERRAYVGWTGYNRIVDETNSVIVFDNHMRVPPIMTIMFYAKKLWDLDRTMDINLTAQKTPILLEADKESKLTILNAFKSFVGNMPVIFAKKGANLANSVNVLKTDAPFIADKISQIRKEYWNEALSNLGIMNVNIGKKERLVQDEVKNSLGDINGILQNKLSERLRACDDLNRMLEGRYDKKISVSINQALIQTGEESEEGEASE